MCANKMTGSSLQLAGAEAGISGHLLNIYYGCFIDTGVCAACDWSEEHKIRLRSKGKPGEYVVHPPARVALLIFNLNINIY
jgi:hypothetical protein